MRCLSQIVKIIFCNKRLHKFKNNKFLLFLSSTLLAVCLLATFAYAEIGITCNACNNNQSSAQATEQEPNINYLQTDTLQEEDNPINNLDHPITGVDESQLNDYENGCDWQDTSNFNNFLEEQSANIEDCVKEDYELRSSNNDTVYSNIVSFNNDESTLVENADITNNSDSNTMVELLEKDTNSSENDDNFIANVIDKLFLFIENSLNYISGHEENLSIENKSQQVQQNLNDNESTDGNIFNQSNSESANLKTTTEDEDNLQCTHSGYTKWTSNNSLPTSAGKYYLNNDVELSTTWTCYNKITICLNGHNIISKENSSTDSVIFVANTEFTLTDCSNNPGSVKHRDGCYGFGVFVDNKSTFNMYEGKICNNINNSSAKSGAGVSVERDSTFNLYGGEISGNKNLGYDDSSNGAGVAVNNGSTFNMKGGLISNNFASNFGGGVGIDENSKCVIDGGTIKGNSATSGGGGISTSSCMQISNCSILNNSAEFGGGLEVSESDTDYNNNFTIKNCDIKSNNGSAGGGIYNAGCIYVQDCVIDSNSVDTEGGGIANFSNNFTAKMYVNSSSIQNNYSGNTGGAIFNHGGNSVNSVINIVDTIIDKNTCDLNGIIYSSNASLSIQNGSVCDNTNSYAGFGLMSVGSSSIVELSGSLKINNNKTQGYNQNICLIDGSEIKLSSSNPLSSDSCFGVSIYKSGVGFTGGNVTTSNAKDLTSHFVGETQYSVYDNKSNHRVILGIIYVCELYKETIANKTYIGAFTSIEDAIYEANEDTSSSNNYLIKMISDYAPNSTTYFHSADTYISHKFTLDLNGKTLNGQSIPLYSSLGHSVLYVVYGSNLTLTDTSSSQEGKICNCKNGAVYNSGTFIMSQGMITKNSSTTGGAIFNRSNLTINGGKITNNSSTNGGSAIYNVSTMHLYGANISDNSGLYAVYSNKYYNTSTILGGDIQITDNIYYDGSSNRQSNLVLSKDQNVSLDENKKLSKSATIHVNSLNQNSPVQISYPYTNNIDFADRFISDDSSRIVYDVDNDLTSHMLVLGRSCQISFDAKGVIENPPTQTILQWHKITEPTIEDVPGKKFICWCEDSECTKQWDFQANKVTQDMCLYAKWELTATVDMFTLTSPTKEHKYDANFVEAEFSVDETVKLDLGKITINYFDSDGNKLSEPPKNVGVYKIKIDVAASSKYKAVSGLTKDDWKIVIIKREITISTGSATKIYDNTPLVNNTFDVTGDGFITEEQPTIIVDESLTYAGSVQNTYSLTWTSGVKSTNYNISDNLGTLRVDKRTVSIKANDNKKAVGEEDPDFDVTITNKIDDGYELDYSIFRALGEEQGTYTITVNAQTDQGNYNVQTQTGILTIVDKAFNIRFMLLEDSGTRELFNQKVYNGDYVVYPGLLVDGDRSIASWYKTEQLTDKWVFNIDKPNNDINLYGKWKEVIKADDLNFDSGSASFIYDGLEHGAKVTGPDGIGEISYRYFTEYGVELEGKPIDVGKYKVVVNISEGFNYGAINDVTGDDWILNITKRGLTISSLGDSRDYNTLPLTKHESNVEGLQNGEQISLLYSCSQTDAGSISNEVSIDWAQTSKLSNPAQEKNYEIKINFGLLTVKPAQIIVSTDGCSSIYDGAKHTVKTGSITIGDNVYKSDNDGRIELFDTSSQEVVLYTTGYQSDAGSSDNTYKLIWNPEIGANPDNYKIDSSTDKLGVLKVEPKPIVIYTNSLTCEYDFEEHTAGGYIDGLVNGETATLVTKGVQKDVGTCVNNYEISWDGIAREGNYVVNTEETAKNIGNITVDYCPVTVYADKQIAEVDAAAIPKLTSKIVYYNSEDEIKPDDGYTITFNPIMTNATVPLPSGNYDIYYDGQNPQIDGNYKITYYKNTLYVTDVKKTVNFDCFGKTKNPPDNQLLLPESKVTKPDDPVADIDKGYDFGGWYKEASCINEWDFDNDIVGTIEQGAETVTIYAKWIRSYVDSQGFIGTKEQSIGNEGYTNFGGSTHAIYNSTLSKLIQGDGTAQDIQFVSESLTLARPYTYAEKASAPEEWKNVTFTANTDTIKFNDTELYIDDVNLKNVSINSSTFLDYHKYKTDGLGYLNDISQTSIKAGDWGYGGTNEQAPFELEASVDKNTWKSYADITFDTSGNINIAIKEGAAASASGNTVTFNDKVLYYRIKSSFVNDGLSINTTSTLQIQPTDNIKNIINQLFEHYDTPFAELNLVSDSKLEPSWAEAPERPDSKDTPNSAYVKGAAYGVDPSCDITYTNDEVNKTFTVDVTEKVTEQSTITTLDGYNAALDHGAILNETQGTFWSLLPSGAEINLNSIKIPDNGYVISKEQIVNYKNSGRTMLKVTALFYRSPIYINALNSSFGKSGYASEPKLSFSLNYSYADVQDRSDDLDLIFSFESTNESLGTLQNHTGEPDNPLYGNNVSSRNSVSGYEDIFTNLNPSRTNDNCFVYGKGEKTITDPIETDPGLCLNVLSPGKTYSLQTETDSLGSYTYRERLEAEDEDIENLVFYNAIEQGDGTETNIWKGRFCSIDTTLLQQVGCQPLVYYSTKSNIDLTNNSSKDFDLTDGAVWSTTPPSDLTKVTAISVDASTSVDGSPFVLNKYRAVSFKILMAAPAWRENIGQAINQASAMYCEGDGALNVHTTEMTRVDLSQNDIVASIEWDDDDNRDVIRPSQVEVDLLVGGKETSVSTTLSQANNWTSNITQMASEAGVILVDENGIEQSLSIKYKTEIEGYSSSCVDDKTQTAHNLKLTMQHTPKTIIIDGNKVWKDCQDSNGSRPKYIDLTLWAATEGYDAKQVDSLRVEPDKAGQWNFSFGEKNYYDNVNDVAKEINYSVKEEYVAGYTVTYAQTKSESNLSTTITNNYDPYGSIDIDLNYAQNATDISKAKQIPLRFTLQSKSATFELEDMTYVIYKDGAQIDSGTYVNGNIINVPQGARLSLGHVRSDIAYKISMDNLPGFDLEDSGLDGKLIANGKCTTSLNFAYNAKGKINLQAYKTISGTDLKDDDFIFECLDEFSNTVSAFVKQSSEQKNKGICTFSDAKFSIDACGTTGVSSKTYKIKEYIPADAKEQSGVYVKNGVTYDSNTYDANFSLTDNGDGTITITQTSFPTISNTYLASTSFSPYAWVTLSGDTITQSQFSFKLEDVTSGTTKLVSSGLCNTDGSINFDKNIDYNHSGSSSDVGTHTYKLSQVIPDGAVSGVYNNIKYDESVYTLNITVYDKGNGYLGYTLKVTDETGAEKNPVFENNAYGGFELDCLEDNGSDGPLSDEFVYELDIEDENGAPLDSEFSYTHSQISGNYSQDSMSATNHEDSSLEQVSLLNSPENNLTNLDQGTRDDNVLSNGEHYTIDSEGVMTVVPWINSGSFGWSPGIWDAEWKNDPYLTNVRKIFVEVEGSEETYDIYVESAFANIPSVELIDLGNIIDRNSSTSILDVPKYNLLFQNCNELQEVKLGNFSGYYKTRWKEISFENAFDGCTKLSKITLCPGFSFGDSSGLDITLPTGAWWACDDDTSTFTTTQGFVNYINTGGRAVSQTWYIAGLTSDFNVNYESGDSQAQGTMTPDTYSSTIDKITLPKPEFYLFDKHVVNWKDESGNLYGADGKGEITKPESGWSDITLTAVWAPDDNKVEVTGGKATIKLKKNEKAVFDRLPRGAHYTVKQVTQEPGWSLTSQSGVSGIIDVDKSLQNAQQTTMQNSVPVAQFTNTFSTTSTSFTPCADVSLVYKDGQEEVKVPLDDGNEFEFNLKETTTGATSPIEQTVKNGPGGGVVFSSINYTTAGEYTYEIKQNQGAASGYVYDSATYTLTVKVGTATRGDKSYLYIESTTLTKDGGSTTSATFKNTCPQPANPTGSLKVSETVLGTNATNKKFTYNLKLIKPDYTESTQIVECYNTAEGTIIDNLEAGTKWFIQEDEGKRPSGYSPSTTGGAQLTYSGTISSGVVSNAAFKHVYSVEALDSTITANKKLYGGYVSVGAYSFKLQDITETPYKDIQTVSCSDGGAITFDAITYTKADTYKYCLTEVVPEDATKTIEGSIITYKDATEAQKAAGGFIKDGISYGAPFRYAQVFVIDNGDGTMSATTKYGNEPPSTEKPLTDESATFENEIAPGSVSVSLAATGVTESAKAIELPFDVKFTRSDSRPLTGSVSWIKLDTSTGYTIDSGSTSLVNGMASFQSLAGYVYKFTNLPAGTKWTVYSNNSPDGFTLTSVVPQSGAVTAGDFEGPQVVNLDWDYKTTGSWHPTARKTLDGLNPSEGEFDFTLCDASNGQVVSQASCGADGSIDFEDVVFSALDDGKTYTYNIAEVNDGRADITYDESVKQIIVDVKDEGAGVLKINDVPVGDLNFNNQTVKSGDLIIENIIETEVGYELIPSEPGTTPFKYTVALKDSSGTALPGTYSWSSSDGRSGTVTDGGTVEMVAGGNVRISGLPDKAKYEITQSINLPIGYTAKSASSVTGNIVAINISRAEFVNSYKPLGVEAKDFITSTLLLTGSVRPSTQLKEFTFELTALDGAPLPQEATGTTISKKIKDETGLSPYINSVSFGNVEYDKVGSYKYTVKQKIESSEYYKGYKLDEDLFTVILKVVDNYGQLKVDSEVFKTDSEGNQEQVDRVLFENTYTTTPIDCDLPIVSNDVIAQTSAPSHEFSFTLDTFKDYPMPKDTPEGLTSNVVKITDKGNKNYNQISYSEAGTYEYTISEINDAASGYTYDGTVYNLVFTVVDNNSELSASYELTKQGNESANSDLTEASFVNIYVNPAKVNPVINKYVEEKSGYPRHDEYTFTFELTANEFYYPMPANTTGTIAYADLSLDKTETQKDCCFADIEFNQIGSFSYTVIEKSDTKPFDYDNSKYILTYDVTLGDGGLIANPSITKVGIGEVNTIDFTNKYNPSFWTVTFDTNGGSEISPKIVEDSMPVSAPETPTKTGYSFDKWCSDSTLINEYDFSQPVTKDITLYAKWNEKESISINETPQKSEYTGTAAQFQVIPIIGPDSGYKIEYSLSSLSVSPIDVNVYDVVITREEDTTYKSFSTTITQGLSVTPKTLTIIPGELSKIYGNPDPELFIFDYSGNVFGQIPGFQGVLERQVGEDVGDYAYSLGSLKIIDNGSFIASNYSILLDAGHHFSITKRSVTFTGESATRYYTGQTYELTNINASGLLEGHTHNVTYHAKGSELGVYVGTITKASDVLIKYNGIDVTKNYDITTVAGTLTITDKVIVIVSNIAATNRVYDGTEDIEFDYSHATINGVVTGDNVYVKQVKGSLDSKNAGNGKHAKIDSIELGGDDAKYYTVSVDQSQQFALVDITPATIKVTAKSGQNKVYREADPELTYSYTGEVSGETASFFGNLSRIEGENAGVYPITGGNLILKDNGEFLSSNYELVLTSGIDFSILRKSILDADVSIDDIEACTYDGTAHCPSPIVEDNRYVPYILQDGIDYTLKYTDNINSGNACVLIEGVGNYKDHSKKTFMINKRLAYVQANDAQKIEGDDDPILTANVMGTIGSDSLVYSIERELGESTGTYAINVIGANDQGNYSVEYKSGEFTIVKAYIGSSATTGDMSVGVLFVLCLFATGWLVVKLHKKRNR